MNMMWCYGLITLIKPLPLTFSRYYHPFTENMHVVVVWDLLEVRHHAFQGFCSVSLVYMHV
jgi:hypothetical protein